jgi:antitoxin YefM
MTVEISFEQFSQELEKTLDRVTNDQEVIIIRRPNGQDVALIPADELSSLMETQYLLRSPANARRLLGALSRALEGEGIAMTVEELRREVGLDQDAADEATPLHNEKGGSESRPYETSIP